MPARRSLVLATALLAVSGGPAEAGTFTKSGVPASSRAPSYSKLARYDHAIVAAKPSVRAKLALAARGARLLSPSLGLWRVPSRSAIDVAERLRLLGVLRYVEPDGPVFANDHLTRGDPLAATDLGWHIYRIGADRAEPPGPGVPITVLDVGLDLNHVEFRSRPNTFLLNEQQISSLQSADYHGTFVASTAAAPADGVGAVGVYPQVALRSYDIPVVRRGEVPSFADSSIIAAIDAAVAAGSPSVINLSFGGPEPSRALHEAVLRAFGAGSIIVASSGNNFQQGDPLNYPGAYPHVVTVAATDRSDLATFFSSSGGIIDVAAPGQGIPFQHPSDSSFRTLSGTSFSAPIVTAAAAWLWTARRNLDKTQVIELLRSSARDLAPAGFDFRTGFGVIDLPAALTRPAPIVDPMEPNDDIFQLTKRFSPQGSKLLTTLRRPNARLTARLERSEDPDDVYRVLIPAGKQVSISIFSGGDPGAILWHPRTTTVLTNNRGAQRNWLTASNKPPRQAERLLHRNVGKTPMVAYLDVWIPKNAAERRVRYTVDIRTSTVRR
jgi:subtilisin family serine protease